MPEKNPVIIEIPLVAKFSSERLRFFCYDFGYNNLKLYEHFDQNLKNNREEFFHQLLHNANERQEVLKLLALASSISSVEHNSVKKDISAEKVNELLVECLCLYEWIELGNLFTEFRPVTNEFYQVVKDWSQSLQNISVVRDKWYDYSSLLKKTIEFTINSEYINHAHHKKSSAKLQCDILEKNRLQIGQIISIRDVEDDSKKETLRDYARAVSTICTRNCEHIKTNIEDSINNLVEKFKASRT